MENHNSNSKKTPEGARRTAAEESKRLAREAELARRDAKISRTRVLFMVLGIVVLSVLTLVFFAFPSKWLVLFACVATVILMLLKYTGGNLARLTSPATVAMTVYMLLCGVSCIYALSGKFFLYEYQKLLVCFFVYLLIITLPGDKKKSARGVATFLSGACAVFAFMSVESASTGVFSAILKHFNGWAALGIGFESGTRLTGIFGNPNMLASMLAIGIYLSLYLLETHEKPWQRYTSVVMLSFNAFAFLLAFSMGGTAMFLVGIVFYLIFAGQGKRINSLLRMVETIIPTVIFVFLAFSAYNGGNNAIPLVAIFSNTLIICLLDRFVYEKLSTLLCGRKKVSSAIFCSVVAVIAIYIALGLSVTGAWTSSGDSLSRSVYPQAGDNTLQVQSDGDVQVVITSQNIDETMTHTSTTLFEGSADNAAFRVPEGSIVMYIRFQSDPGTTVYSAALGSGETIKLDYKLLPGFIANRLQGLRANQNAIQRAVFFADGMALFRQRPIFGNGLGSFESAVPSVQTFYYETKYVHNNYIQTLVDTGAVGFVFYVLTLLFTLIALIKNRKSARRDQVPGIYPALWAAMVIVCGHSAVEITMSMAPSMLCCFAVLGLTILCFGSSIGSKALGMAVRVAAIALTAVFAVLIALNMSANRMVANAAGTTASNFFSAVQKAANIDTFEYNDHKMSYVMSSLNVDSEVIYKKADVYADQLATVKSNSTAPYLLKYYLSRGSYEKAADLLVLAMTYNRANPEAWNDCLGVFMVFYISDSTLFSTPDGQILVDGINSALADMAEFNKTALSPIVLSDESQALLAVLAQKS